jgi:tetratricopeptide (TPR) repeat protein
MQNEEINITADFLTFRNQIVEKFGEQYFDQAEIFFERAMAQAKQGLLHSAISDGKFALDLSYYSNDKSGLQYLIGFLSQLHCDLGQISNSKAYYELGLKLLDSEAIEYEDDKEMYRKLKELIDGENWKGNIENDQDE